LYPLIEEGPLESILNSFQTDYEADYASMMRNVRSFTKEENDKPTDSFIDRKFAADRNGYDHFLQKLSQIKKLESEEAALTYYGFLFYKINEVRIN
jgi:hypothetical protein